MFNFREFLLTGYLDAVGKQNDFWIIKNSSEDYKAGILLDEDMAKIQEAINEKNTPPEISTDPLDPVIEAVCKG